MAEAPPPTAAGSGKLVAIALVLAVVAVVLNLVYVTNMQKKQRGQMVSIYRLTASKKIGEKLEEKDYKEILVPADIADASFYDAIQTPLSIRNTVGEVFVRPAASNDIIVDDMFIGDPKSVDIPISYRRIPIKVESKYLTSGVVPGVHVDIEAPFNTGLPYPEYKTVMENVVIVGVGWVSIEDLRKEDEVRTPRNFETVSIEVKPDEATQMLEIESVAAGPFVLHLRNSGDDRRVKIIQQGINPEVLDMMKTRVRPPERPIRGQ